MNLPKHLLFLYHYFLLWNLLLQLFILFFFYALNTMLRIIFTYTTNFSYTIHFVNKEATSDIRLKEKIEAFSNFQQFFNISKLKIFKIF